MEIETLFSIAFSLYCRKITLITSICTKSPCVGFLFIWADVCNMYQNLLILLNLLLTVICDVYNIKTHFRTLCAGYKSVDSVPGLVEDYLNKKIIIDKFVTHNKSLKDINDAFTLMHEGKR